MRRRALLALPAALAAAPAMAATPALLRPQAVLEGDTLRLSDLWEHAGPRGETPLAAAPLPGRRLVLEAPHLAAIARAHGVAWRPLTGQERVVVERAGRPVARADIEALVQSALLRHGTEPEAEIELAGFVPPLVPTATPHQLALEGLHLEQPGGARFSATLVVLAEGTPAQRLRLAGRVLPTAPVVLATRRMALGEVVGPLDVRLVRMRAERVRPGLAQQPSQVVGQELRRPMAVDQGFALADLDPPTVVAKNSLVTLVLEAPGLQLSAQGRALEAAARGAPVPVLNLASRAVVEGVALAPGRVRVAMGATPLPARP